MSDHFISPGRRLQLLQTHDHHTPWWNLDESRFCRRCHKLIIGKDIVITLDERDNPHFACPTYQCPGTFEDWGYPQLHL